MTKRNSGRGGFGWLTLPYRRQELKQRLRWMIITSLFPCLTHLLFYFIFSCNGLHPPTSIIHEENVPIDSPTSQSRGGVFLLWGPSLKMTLACTKLTKKLTSTSTCFEAFFFDSIQASKNLYYFSSVLSILYTSTCDSDPAWFCLFVCLFFREIFWVPCLKLVIFLFHIAICFKKILLLELNFNFI